MKHIPLNLVVQALLAAGLCGQPLVAGAAPRADVVGLGSLGGSYSYAFGINASG